MKRFGLFGWLTALLASALLTGCFEEEKVSLSYLGVNHTDRPIVSVAINDEGGILNVSAQGGGGKMVCCVTLPRKWHPGLKVKIAWQEDGHWLLDEHGKPVIRDGVKVLVEEPWQSQTVDVPEYGEHDLSHFDIHFLPGGKVQVKASFLYPWHPDYRPAYPVQKPASQVAPT
jgi:hypothetical protein